MAQDCLGSAPPPRRDVTRGRPLSPNLGEEGPAGRGTAAGGGGLAPAQVMSSGPASVDGHALGRSLKGGGADSPRGSEVPPAAARGADTGGSTTVRDLVAVRSQSAPGSRSPSCAPCLRQCGLLSGQRQADSPSALQKTVVSWVPAQSPRTWLTATMVGGPCGETVPEQTLRRGSSDAS